MLLKSNNEHWLSDLDKLQENDKWYFKSGVTKYDVTKYLPTER